jgi:hypothetical protein
MNSQGFKLLAHMVAAHLTHHAHASPVTVIVPVECGSTQMIELHKKVAPQSVSHILMHACSTKDRTGSHLVGCVYICV